MCSMGTQPTSQKCAEPPIFGPCLLRPNGCMDQHATWYGGRPQLRRHCARLGHSFFSSKRGRSPLPQFSAHVHCGQTPGCIKMPLGVEVGLSPGDCVRWGPSPSPKRGQSPSPIFGPCLLWLNCWMDQDGTWHGGGTWSRPHCARWGPSSPPIKGGRASNFRPIFIVDKRLDASRCHLVWR